MISVARRSKHGPRQPRGAAAGLEHQRQRRIARRVEAYEVTPRRIAADRLAQVVHGERWNLQKIVEAANIARLHTRCAPMPLIEGDLPRALHLSQKALFLQRAQRVAGKRVALVKALGSRGKLLPQW